MNSMLNWAGHGAEAESDVLAARHFPATIGRFEERIGHQTQDVFRRANHHRDNQ